MNSQEILNAAFDVLLWDYPSSVSVSPTAFVWDDGEAEHWMMQIAMGKTLSVQIDKYKGKDVASPCLR